MIAMVASQPPPGWSKKVRLLQAIIDRAEAKITVAALRGVDTTSPERTRALAYRQLEPLMAMRPPVRGHVWGPA